MATPRGLTSFTVRRAAHAGERHPAADPGRGGAVLRRWAARAAHACSAAALRRALLVAVVAALAVAAAAAGALRLGAPARAAAPVLASDRQIAQETVGRYFTLIDEGRGADFCSGAISGATLAAEGGIYRCAPAIDGYVRRIRSQLYTSELQNLHALFYMVQDGIASHCPAGGRCPRALYARWASKTAPPGVAWKTGSDPRLASSTGSTVVAVVDPRRSSPSWITLFYQTMDGRILRASWSTGYGSWRGSVVDTHAGEPFISHVRVLSTRREADGSLLAAVSIHVGTAATTVQQFHLVREGGSWRADSWRNVTAALSD